MLSRLRRLPRLLRRPPVAAVVRPPAPRWPLYAGLFLGIALSLLLYAGTLSLPYLQEDSTHIRWLSWHNPIEPFFSAEGAPAYRPLGKSIIKVWYLLLGEHDRAWLRYHNIAFNALNIALIAVLASCIDTSRRRYWTAGIAAVLFGTFPFAYQAIPWINNFFYPLANLLLLLMTAVYWQARVRQSTSLLIVALFLCFLAPFEIEYGLMGSGVLFTVELVLWLQKRQPYPWMTGPLLGLAMNFLFLVRWFTIPKQTYAFGPPTAGRLLLISTYFLQGLMYPVSPLALRLMALTGMGDVAAIWLVSVPLLMVLVVVVWRAGQVGLLVFGLLWFVLLNLPALVFVDFDYVVNSPRLLYPPGVGIVLLWAVFLGVLAIGRTWRQVRLAATGVFLALVVTFSITFVRERLFHYHLAEQPILQLAAAARVAEPENRLLVVNFPSWISPQVRRFAMGNHGAQIIPFYVNIQELIYAHNDADHPATAVQFANVRQPQPYYYGMLGEHVDYEKLRTRLQESGDVYLTEWRDAEVELVPAGRVTGFGISSSGETGFRFGEALRMTPANVEVEGDAITVSLQWELLARPEQDYTVFAHVYGPDGQLVSQADGYPLLGLAPFWLWDSGQTLQDTRYFALPADLPPGSYTIGAGVYDAATGERLDAFGPDGMRLANDTAILYTFNR